MKGIVLAGGTGTRLGALTKVVNKHLLPVYDRPMIFYPIQILVSSGITSIMIVTDKRRAGDFMNLLGSGREFGARFTYGLQDEASGIADAIYIAKDFANNDDVTVILGDNVFLGKVPLVNRVDGKGRIYLKREKESYRFGVAVIKKGSITDLVEKPADDISDLVVTGLYQYPPDVFGFIEKLKPSHRNEVEVTDLNRAYLKESRLSFKILKNKWVDAGTVQSLYDAQRMVKKYQKALRNIK